MSHVRDRETGHVMSLNTDPVIPRKRDRHVGMPDCDPVRSPMRRLLAAPRLGPATAQVGAGSPPCQTPPASPRGSTRSRAAAANFARLLLVQTRRAHAPRPPRSGAVPGEPQPAASLHPQHRAGVRQSQKPPAVWLARRSRAAQRSQAWRCRQVSTGSCRPQALRANRLAQRVRAREPAPASFSEKPAGAEARLSASLAAALHRHDQLRQRAHVALSRRRPVVEQWVGTRHRRHPRCARRPLGPLQRLQPSMAYTLPAWQARAARCSQECCSLWASTDGCRCSHPAVACCRAVGVTNYNSTVQTARFRTLSARLQRQHSCAELTAAAA